MEAAVDVLKKGPAVIEEFENADSATGSEFSKDTLYTFKHFTKNNVTLNSHHSSSCNATQHQLGSTDRPVLSEKTSHGDFLKKHIEIVIQLLQLNDSLLLIIKEEKQLLNGVTKFKKKGKCKYKIFEINILIEMLKGHIANWNAMCQLRNKNLTGYLLPLSFTDLMQDLKFTFIQSVCGFLNRMQQLIYLGLQLLAFQGIQDIPASLLQKAIIGIVAYNNFLSHFDDYLHSTLMLFSCYDGQQVSNLLPKPMTITEMLKILAQNKAMVFSKLLNSLIQNNILHKVETFSKAVINNDWQWWLPMAGHVNVGLWIQSSQMNKITGTGQSVTSDYSSENGETRHSFPATSSVNEPQHRLCDALYIELQTISTQEELNLSKLVSIIHLSFMDVQNRKSNKHQNWLLMNTENCIGSAFTKAAMQNQCASNFYACYKRELQNSIFDNLRTIFESPATCNSENLEFTIGSLLLLSPQHVIELGDCALDLCYSLEKQVPLIQVYHNFTSYCYLLASFKTWDLNFCKALAAISNPKCVPTLLRNSGYGTLAGNYLVHCLEPLIGLELIAHTKSDFDLDGIHSGIFPRLVATLDTASSWMEMHIHHTLYSWNVAAFTLITHGDLKRIIDLLKHIVSVNPVQRSSSFHHTSEQSSLSFREALMRHLVLWEDIGKAVTRIQNCSSTCMKHFCKACEQKAKDAFQEYMPAGKVWRQRCKRKGIPTECNAYAKILVDDVMLPVVDGVGQLPIPVQIGMVSMATKVFCETWMSHILGSQIKFSLHGAHLLKLDFNYLMEFLHSQSSLSMETRQSVQSLEILRHLRGVAALLLRQNEPSHPSLVVRSRKVAPLRESSDIERQEDAHQMEGIDGSESMTSDSLMDEDYVIDKETWLSLRVHQFRSFNRTPFWCFS